MELRDRIRQSTDWTNAPNELIELKALLESSFGDFASSPNDLASFLLTPNQLKDRNAFLKYVLHQLYPVDSFWSTGTEETLQQCFNACQRLGFPATFDELQGRVSMEDNLAFWKNLLSLPLAKSSREKNHSLPSFPSDEDYELDNVASWETHSFDELPDAFGDHVTFNEEVEMKIPVVLFPLPRQSMAIGGNKIPEVPNTILSPVKQQTVEEYLKHRNSDGSTQAGMTSWDWLARLEKLLIHFFLIIFDCSPDASNLMMEIMPPEATEQIEEIFQILLKAEPEMYESLGHIVELAEHWLVHWKGNNAKKLRAMRFVKQYMFIMKTPHYYNLPVEQRLRKLGAFIAGLKDLDPESINYKVHDAATEYMEKAIEARVHIQEVIKLSQQRPPSPRVLPSVHFSRVVANILCGRPCKDPLQHPPVYARKLDKTVFTSPNVEFKQIDTFVKARYKFQQQSPVPLSWRKILEQTRTRTHPIAILNTKCWLPIYNKAYKANVYDEQCCGNRDEIERLRIKARFDLLRPTSAKTRRRVAKRLYSAGEAHKNKRSRGSNDAADSKGGRKGRRRKGEEGKLSMRFRHSDGAHDTRHEYHEHTHHGGNRSAKNSWKRHSGDDDSWHSNDDTHGDRKRSKKSQNDRNSKLHGKNSTDNDGTRSRKNSDNDGTRSRKNSDNDRTRSRKNSDNYGTRSRNNSDNYGTRSRKNSDNDVSWSRKNSDNDGRASRKNTDHDGNRSRKNTDHDGNRSRKNTDHDGNRSRKNTDHDGNRSRKNTDHDGNRSRKNTDHDGIRSRKNSDNHVSRSRKNSDNDGRMSNRNSDDDGWMSNRNSDDDGWMSNRNSNNDGNRSRKNTDHVGNRSRKNTDHDGNRSRKNSDHDGNRSRKNTDHDGKISRKNSNNDVSRSRKNSDNDGRTSRKNTDHDENSHKNHLHWIDDDDDDDDGAGGKRKSKKQRDSKDGDSDDEDDDNYRKRKTKKNIKKPGRGFNEDMDENDTYRADGRKSKKLNKGRRIQDTVDDDAGDNRKSMRREENGGRHGKAHSVFEEDDSNENPRKTVYRSKGKSKKSQWASAGGDFSPDEKRDSREKSKKGKKGSKSTKKSVRNGEGIDPLLVSEDLFALRFTSSNENKSRANSLVASDDDLHERRSSNRKKTIHKSRDKSLSTKSSHKPRLTKKSLKASLGALSHATEIRIKPNPVEDLNEHIQHMIEAKKAEAKRFRMSKSLGDLDDEEMANTNQRRSRRKGDSNDHSFDPDFWEKKLIGTDTTTSKKLKKRLRQLQGLDADGSEASVEDFEKFYKFFSENEANEFFIQANSLERGKLKCAQSLWGALPMPSPQILPNGKALVCVEGGLPIPIQPQNILKQDTAGGLQSYSMIPEQVEKYKQVFRDDARTRGNPRPSTADVTRKMIERTGQFLSKRMDEQERDLVQAKLKTMKGVAAYKKKNRSLGLSQSEGSGLHSRLKKNNKRETLKLSLHTKPTLAMNLFEILKKSKFDSDESEDPGEDGPFKAKKKEWGPFKHLHPGVIDETARRFHGVTSGPFFPHVNTTDKTRIAFSLSETPVRKAREADFGKSKSSLKNRKSKLGGGDGFEEEEEIKDLMKRPTLAVRQKVAKNRKKSKGDSLPVKQLIEDNQQEEEFEDKFLYPVTLSGKTRLKSVRATISSGLHPLNKVGFMNKGSEYVGSDGRGDQRDDVVEEAKDPCWDAISQMFKSPLKAPAIPLPENLVIHIEKKYPMMEWPKGIPVAMRYYPSGQPFCIIFQNGAGRVHYPHGGIAALISAPQPRYCRVLVIRDPFDKFYFFDKAVKADFNSNGKGIVYDEKNLVRVQYNLEGGFSQDGLDKPVQRWRWNEGGHRMVLKLNRYMALRILDIDKMYLSFFGNKRGFRINVGAGQKVNLMSGSCDSSKAFPPSYSDKEPSCSGFDYIRGRYSTPVLGFVDKARGSSRQSFRQDHLNVSGNLEPCRPSCRIERGNCPEYELRSCCVISDCHD